MIIDACGTDCLTVDFAIGTDTTTARTLDIRVSILMNYYHSGYRKKILTITLDNNKYNGT